MNNKNSMSKATYRYLRIMEVYRHNLHICWCTRCENEIIWVDFYPLHEGLCKSCRKEKASEKASQEGLPTEEESN